MHWTAADWVTLCTALAALTGAIAAGTLKVLAAIREIHLSINSRMDELVLETRKSSLAEGRDQMRAAIVAQSGGGQASPPTPVVQVEQIQAKTIVAETIELPPHSGGR